MALTSTVGGEFGNFSSLKIAYLGNNSFCPKGIQAISYTSNYISPLKEKVNLVKVKKNYNCDFIDINQLNVSQIEWFKYCLFIKAVEFTN